MALTLHRRWHVVALQAPPQKSRKQLAWRWGDMSAFWEGVSDSDSEHDEGESMDLDIGKTIDVKLEFLADCVRRWSRSLPPEEAPFCAAVLDMVDSTVQDLRAPSTSQHHDRHGGRTGRRYHSSHLLRFLLLANLITNNREIGEVLDLATGLQVPEQLRHLVESQMQHTHQAPLLSHA